MKVSAVMPVYNERRTILEALRRILGRPELAELVIVDDGSTDGTPQVLEAFLASRAAEGPEVRLIRRAENAGKGSALRQGFAAATGDVVIVQDADLEYDPRDYPAILAPILDGEADAVYGSRFLGGGRHRVLLFWHSIANKMLTLLVDAVANVNLTDVWTGYKVFRGDLIRSLPLASNRFGFEPEVTIKLARLGAAIFEVPISYRGRSYAEGKKIGFRDAVSSLGTIVRTACFPNLGEASKLSLGPRESAGTKAPSPGS